VSARPAWCSRTVGAGEAAPDQLVANPSDRRIHPKAQQQVLGGVLALVCRAGQALVSQRTGRFVDGHLRVALAISRGKPCIPVLFVDLSGPTMLHIRCQTTSRSTSSRIA
jgi:hypothetical protein